MGSFYTNYTLRGPSQQAVAAALVGRSAIVTPAQDGCVVVFDEESDAQNQEVISELAGRLSGAFGCPLLAVLNHDDDIFWYQLYVNGELMDQYNSSPGYFETRDEKAAMTGPEGGDAKKICDAFGVNSTKEVERILRKSSFDDEGYTFAMERHADLAGALGIPSFSVGAGYDQISAGEPPEEFLASDLVSTKDLIVAPGSPKLTDFKSKAVPGYYKVSFRAHPKLTKSIPTAWMPSLWADNACPEQELSSQFRKATTMLFQEFKKLGFTEQGFKKLTRVLNPNSRDMGGINFLDASRSQFGQLIYNRSFIPSSKDERETVVIAFTAVFEKDNFSCTNHVDFLEPIPSHNVVRLQSNDVAFIYGQFVQHLKQRPDSPRRFPDLPSLQAWFDSNAVEIFNFRVHRGTWVRMSDYEVALARRDS